MKRLRFMNKQVFFNFYFDILNKNTIIFLIIYLFIYFLNISSVFIIFTNKELDSNNITKTIINSINNKAHYYYLLLAFSSILGIPPLSGFISKFILSYFVFIKHNFFVLVIFYTLIFLSLFFYLQILKLIKKTTKNSCDLLKKNKKLKINNKFKFIFILNLLAIFSIFFIFLFKDFYIIMLLF